MKNLRRLEEYELKKTERDPGGEFEKSRATMLRDRANTRGSGKIQSTTEQFQFVPDDVNVIIKESIEEVLENETWHCGKQEQWNNRIMESVLEKLSLFKKPYKYVVQCTTVQRTGCVIHVANACYWNVNTDGSVTVRWENSYLYVIVSVFGLFV